MRRTTCPTCRKHVSTANDNPWRPFCSERCRLIDLGEWMNGNRQITSGETMPEAVRPRDPDIKH
ncbi:MAG: DNA gyrase inhibitor YacG [Gammaproteobacteria bacterium]|nr:DNA gyrase inhibitor YacG [Gammaproteobacteria bacterium]